MVMIYIIIISGFFSNEVLFVVTTQWISLFCDESIYHYWIMQPNEIINPGAQLIGLHTFTKTFNEPQRVPLDNADL